MSTKRQDNKSRYDTSRRKYQRDNSLLRIIFVHHPTNRLWSCQNTFRMGVGTLLGVFWIYNCPKLCTRSNLWMHRSKLSKTFPEFSWTLVWVCYGAYKELSHHDIGITIIQKKGISICSWVLNVPKILLLSFFEAFVVVGEWWCLVVVA